MGKPIVRSVLGVWMDEAGLGPDEVAEKLSVVRQVPTYKSNVSQWANSRQDPSDPIIVAVEVVSGGRVRRDDWPCWRKRAARRARRSA